MLLKVKKRLFSWYIVDENNKIVALIKNIQFFGAAKHILDENRQIVFTTNIINLPSEKWHWNCADSRKYIISDNSKTIATASLTFAVNPYRTTVQKFTLKPPQVDEIKLETPYRIWYVKREKNNSINVLKNEQTLTKFSAFFNFQRQQIQLLSDCNPIFITAVYMLVEYMMHEDDLIVV